jgi:hypothetical protein
MMTLFALWASSQGQKVTSYLSAEQFSGGSLPAPSSIQRRSTEGWKRQEVFLMSTFGKLLLWRQAGASWGAIQERLV